MVHLGCVPRAVHQVGDELGGAHPATPLDGPCCEQHFINKCNVKYKPYGPWGCVLGHCTPKLITLSVRGSGCRPGCNIDFCYVPTKALYKWLYAPSVDLVPVQSCVNVCEGHMILHDNNRVPGATPAASNSRSALDLVKETIDLLPEPKNAAPARPKGRSSRDIARLRQAHPAIQMQLAESEDARKTIEMPHQTAILRTQKWSQRYKTNLSSLKQRLHDLQREFDALKA